MSTPEQPETPALTRKQLRDIRNTGATPIQTADGAKPDVDAETAPGAGSEDNAQGAPAVDHTPRNVAPPFPRAAMPPVMHDLPGADASVDLGVSPLTRRQARQQERIRTASVSVISPEAAAAAAAAAQRREAGLGEEEDAVASDVESADAAPDENSEAVPDEISDASLETDAAPDESATSEATAAEAPERAVVNPQFGAELLSGDVHQVELPASFDQLITRSMTGAIGAGNALILSQTPAAPPLGAPVTSTGEVLITGSFDLPEGLGSTGHAPGTADGKDVDAVLVDGELPAHSSPTPIAASAAVSTVKNGGDIIKPPAPEKGGRLMLTLAITAGALALALVGVLILAFVTGVF